MVLPPSIADHPAGPSQEWLSRIARILELGSGGVLALVHEARPACLRPLVLALQRTARAANDRLHVCLRAAEVMEVPGGGLVLLRVDAADLDWLNENRPLFFEQRLRVILWTEADTAAALRRHAPDFFDWISHVVDCPDGVPGFAIASLRQAPPHPGIVWRGGDLDAALAAAFPGEPVTRIASLAYAGLVEAAATMAGWLICPGVSTPPELTRIRLAMAEAGRDGHVIIAAPQCHAPGFWPATGQCMAWDVAARMLQQHGVENAALVAALLDLEPGAIMLAAEHVDAFPEHGGAMLDLLCQLAPDADPGAALARVVAVQGDVDLERVAQYDALPAVLRGLQHDAGVSERRAALIAKVDSELREWAEYVEYGTIVPPWRLEIGEMAIWASARPANPPPIPVPYPAHPASAYWLEALLAATRISLGRLDWSAAVNWVMWLGHYEVAEHWARTRDVGIDMQAAVLHAQGKYRDAERLLRQVLAEPAHRQDRSRQGLWQNLLASTLAEQGRYAEAEALLREVLAQQRDDEKENSSAVHLLAEVLTKQGSYAQAEELFRRSLESIENEGGTADPRYGAALHALADVLAQQGKHAAAEPLSRQALEAKEKTHGLAHPSYMATLAQLAGILASQKKYEQAEALHRQNMDSAVRLLGTEHPFVETMQAKLVHVLLGQGKFEEAEAILREVLASIENTRGTEYPSYGAVLHDLGVLHARQGQYAQAESALRRALAVQERLLGSEHLEVAQTLVPLALVLAAQQRSDEARTLAQRVRNIIDARLSSEHPIATEIDRLLSNL